MNPLLPLAAVSLGVGVYAYKKKHPTPAAKLETIQKQQGALTAASWETHLSVHDVQHDLNELGAKPPLAEDGVLGPKTTAAIKSFQATAGIAVDGIVGPETTNALAHALGGGSAATGWFAMDEDCDEDECEIGASVVGAIDASRPGRGIRQAIEGGQMVGAASWGGSSADWGAPNVADILSDPQQRMQIGNLEMWQEKAREAFPDTKAAGYDYSFLPDDGQSELAEYGQVFGDLEAERQAALNAVSGAYSEELRFERDEEDSDDEDDADLDEAAEDYADKEVYTIADEDYDDEIDMVGGDDWSAPDMDEALADPVQRAQMAEFSPWGYEREYEPYYAEEAYYPPAVMAPIQGPPYLPFPANTQGFYAPNPGYVMNPATAVPGEGYEFQSQTGRRF